ncbi:protein DDI1 homolog 2-like [Bolinopsis microptera]|uniref:protein DDI1 homolog 2-like n=1 Tax=Bolinopsis microptera TaxID=2820187 RepID=UPI00307B092C
MNIVVTSPDGNFYSLEVSSDLELENLLALVSVESGKPTEHIQLSLNGIPLLDKKKTLTEYNVKDGDMMLMTTTSSRPPSSQPRAPSQPSQQTGNMGSLFGGTGINWGAINVPGQGASPVARPPPVDECEKLRLELLGDPYQLSILKERDPQFAAAIDNKDQFKKVFNERQELIRKRKREEELLLSGNPMDPEYQKKIYEMLQGKQIEENLSTAMEEHPESFGQVIMLYIDCEVNGHKVKAFVDSGAQMTLISAACAERVSVSRLIDKRFQGVAKGVGTQKILGRVHLLPLKIGNDHFPCTFSVLEHQPMDMLLGLDMLKRHQCVIDLKENCLKIGTTSTTAAFLSEKDIPKSTEESDQQPSGSSQGSSAAGGPTATVTDENVSKLVDMGFTPEQSRKALGLCGNNVDLAASLLFEKGGQV